MMGLRIYFNQSGAIDVYSKAKAGLELRKYLWYPTEAQMRNENAGCDEYFVGKSLGLGGIALWDGEKMLRLEITRGRRARVGATANGHFAEMISYGVPYKGDFVDISIRIDVFNDSRSALVTASCINGRKVQFVTGVNYNDNAQIEYGKGRMAVWGVHPANVSQHPVPIGGGMVYDPSVFPRADREESMIRLISVPATKVCTRVISASAKEKGMDFRKFKKLIKATGYAE